MIFKALLPALSVAWVICLAGCSPSNEGDTSPRPVQDPQASLNTTITNIEASKMSPDEKKAAIEYAKQNAANAAKMKQSIQRSQTGQVK